MSDVETVRCNRCNLARDELEIDGPKPGILSNGYCRRCDRILFESKPDYPFYYPYWIYPSYIPAIDSTPQCDEVWINGQKIRVTFNKQ